MSWLEIILHAFGVGTSHGLTRTHMTHHGPDSGEANTFPLIVFSATLCRGYIQVTLFLRTPKFESRNCPGWSPGTLGAHISRLQSPIGVRSEPML
jgi:hypothetical protein